MSLIRNVGIVLLLAIPTQWAIAQAPTFNPMVTIRPNPLPTAPNSPPAVPAPRPSLWNWDFLPIGHDPNNPPAFPNITQELYEEIPVTNGFRLTKNATTTWGVSSHAGMFSSFSQKNDVVLNALEGRDLIITNRQEGRAIRIGTTVNRWVPTIPSLDTERITILHDGRIGINNPLPHEMMEIGSQFVLHSGGWKYIGYNLTYNPVTQQTLRIDAGAASRIAFAPSGDISLESYDRGLVADPLVTSNHLRLTRHLLSLWNENEGELFTVVGDTTGFAGTAYFKHKVFIGTLNPGLTPSGSPYMLAVNGSVKAKELIVDCNGWTAWPDYVFDPDYKLMPLDTLGRWVNEHRHLPGVPSAREVAVNGVSVGELQARLLEKVEELTLHVVRLNEDNKALRERVWQLERRDAGNRGQR